MNRLRIEWRHFETDGETCVRCSETGKTLFELVEELKKELAARDIEVVFSETKLPVEEIGQSNMILLNSIPLENWSSGAKASENICSSCCELIGDEVCCRTIEYEGKTFEAIPEELIRRAVNEVVNQEQE